MSYFRVIFLAEVILLPFVVFVFVCSIYLFLSNLHNAGRKIYSSRKFISKLLINSIITLIALGLTVLNTGDINNVVFPLAFLLAMFMQFHFFLDGELARTKNL